MGQKARATGRLRVIKMGMAMKSVICCLISLFSQASLRTFLFA